MLKIKQKVKQITNENTKRSYQKALKYLFGIIQILFKQNQFSSDMEMKSWKTGLDKQKRVRSEEKNYINRSDVKIPQNQMLESDYKRSNQQSQIIQIQQLEGKSISFIQKYNKKIVQMAQNQPSQCQIQIKGQNHRKKEQLDKRGLQLTIEIYHQCLLKSLNIVKLQHQFICSQRGKQISAKQFEREKQIVYKLNEFLEKYNLSKKQCKTFNDLLCLSQKILAEQFLSILNPFKYMIDRRKSKNIPLQYVIYI